MESDLIPLFKPFVQKNILTLYVLAELRGSSQTGFSTLNASDSAIGLHSTQGVTEACGFTSETSLALCDMRALPGKDALNNSIQRSGSRNVLGR